MPEVNRDYLDVLAEKTYDALMDFKAGHDEKTRDLSLEPASAEYGSYMNCFAKVVSDVGRNDPIISVSFNNMLTYGAELSDRVSQSKPRHLIGGSLAMFSLNVRRMNEFRISIPGRLASSY
ncbi:MAG: hypothetical protein AABX11_05395 [Nanoarchaeota archaeon]